MAIGLGAKGNLRGTVAPETVVTARIGELYQATDQNFFGKTYIKKLFDATNFGWRGFAETDVSGRRYYVSAGGGSDDSPLFDGLSPGSAFNTIQKAIDTLALAPGTIYIAASGTSYAPFTVAAGQGALRLVGSAEASSNGVVVAPSSNTTDAITINSGNHSFEHINTVSTATTWSGVGWNIDQGSHNRFLGCSHTGRFQPSVSNGGTGWKIINTEGAFWQNCNCSLASVGLDLGSEASTNTFFLFRGATNWKSLYQHSNSGGNLFWGWKTTAAGDPVTPSLVVDMGGGNNVLVGCDFDEAGANLAEVSSDNNIIIGLVTAPATGMTISGDSNYILGWHINGAAGTISGDKNIVVQPDLRGGGTQLTFSGANNILLSENRPDGVSGTYYRGLFYDTSGNLTGGLDPKGRYFTASHAAPADADIAAGQAYFWFDQTNGAAKLMVKAKEAGGTVRTGSVTLS